MDGFNCEGAMENPVDHLNDGDMDSSSINNVDSDDDIKPEIKEEYDEEDDDWEFVNEDLHEEANDYEEEPLIPVVSGELLMKNAITIVEDACKAVKVNIPGRSYVPAQDSPKKPVKRKKTTSTPPPPVVKKMRIIPPRSCELRYCLLCYKRTDKEKVKEGSTPNVEETPKGADFRAMFILKKMLKIPNENLTEYLHKFGGVGEIPPRNWLKFCSFCQPTINNAVEIQKKIIRLEESLRMLQYEMIERIKMTQRSKMEVTAKSSEDVIRVTNETRTFVSSRKRIKGGTVTNNKDKKSTRKTRDQTVGASTGIDTVKLESTSVTDGKKSSTKSPYKQRRVSRKRLQQLRRITAERLRKIQEKKNAAEQNEVKIEVPLPNLPSSPLPNNPVGRLGASTGIGVLETTDPLPTQVEKPLSRPNTQPRFRSRKRLQHCRRIAQESVRKRKEKKKSLELNEELIPQDTPAALPHSEMTSDDSGVIKEEISAEQVKKPDESDSRTCTSPMKEPPPDISGASEVSATKSLKLVGGLPPLKGYSSVFDDEEDRQSEKVEILQDEQDLIAVMKTGYRCPMCPHIKEGMDFNFFACHLLFHYRRPYKCSDCGTHFASTSSLELDNCPATLLRPEGHLCSSNTLVKTTLDTEKLLIWGCDYCDERFSGCVERDLHESKCSQKKDCRHLNHRAEPIKLKEACDFCDKRFRNIVEWRLHMILEHSEMASCGCNYCDQTFIVKTKEDIDLLDNEKLKNHEINFHCSSNEMWMVQVCDFCGKPLWGGPSIQEHMEAEHKIPKNKSISCEICHHRSSLKSKIRYHQMKIHFLEGRKMHICEICGYENVRELRFEHHKFMEHGVEPVKRRVHSCSEEGCEFKTVMNVAMQRHKMKEHNAERKHTCETCGKGFLSFHYLRRHQAIHVNKNVKPFQCEICGNSFAVKNYLYIHMRLSHQNRPFASTHKKKPPRNKNGVETKTNIESNG